MPMALICLSPANLSWHFCGFFNVFLHTAQTSIPVTMITAWLLFILRYFTDNWELYIMVQPTTCIPCWPQFSQKETQDVCTCKMFWLWRFTNLAYLRLESLITVLEIFHNLGHLFPYVLFFLPLLYVCLIRRFCLNCDSIFIVDEIEVFLCWLAPFMNMRIGFRKWFILCWPLLLLGSVLKHLVVNR